MTAAKDTVPAGWEGILAPGERILWQGRPDADFTLRGHNVGLMVLGGLFTVAALVLIAIGVFINSVELMLAPLIHLAIGLGVLFGPAIWRAYVRRGTFYTLTDRRAIIATDAWPKGRDLGLHDIGPSAPVRLIDQPFAGVHFALRKTRGKRGIRMIPFGFERIADAKAVFDLMTSLQQGKA